jgi:hypothetical protein
MSTPLLEDVTLLAAHAVLCPDARCASPAYIEDRWTCKSTDGSVEVLKVRCSAGCWYTILADDLSPATDR